MTVLIRQPPSARNNDKLIHITGQTTVRDVILDGNLPNRGPWEDYQLEQSSLITAIGADLTVEGVTLQNNPGDGISLRTGTTAHISDVEAVDCFRGGVTIAGSDITAVVERYHGSGDVAPAYIQMEAPSAGHTNANLHLIDSVVPKIELEGLPGSTVIVEGTTILGGLWLTAAGGGHVEITDCNIGLVDARFLNEVRHAVDVTFTRCTFTGAGLKLSPQIGATAPPAQRLTFVDCTFTGTGHAAIYNNGATADRDDRVSFEGTNTWQGFSVGYYLRPGFHGPTTGTFTPA